MADLKISALTGATTPLGGTEEIPLVQSSTSKKVTVANLTAGRVVPGTSFSATVAGFQVYSGANALIEMKYSGGAILGRFTGTTLYITENGTPQITVAPTSGNVTFNTGNLVQGTAAKGVNFTANTPAAGMTSQLLNWYEEGTWTPTQGAGLTVVGAFTSVGTYTRVGRQVTVCGNVEGATSVTMTAGQLCTNMPYSANVTINISTGTVLNNTLSQSGACLAVGTELYSSSFATVKQLTFTCTYFV